MKIIVLIALIIIVAMYIFRVGISSAAQLPTVGQIAPDFRLPDQNGVVHTRDAFKGNWLVLYFYPKDDTPGCTKQACTFRDDLYKLEAIGARIVGVSVDSSTSHADFARKYHLPFPLLADQKGEVATRYGSLVNLGVAKFAKRNTFLIDPEGKIAKVYVNVNASKNSEEVLSDLNKLIKQTK